ncbi:MAG: hypothetical protein A3G13_01175 [Candidatus Levybacteria bacterium RIFCSPLOWO2_12_FULL_37_7]|nr:MAG: hypothetical protein A3G13_01175 [Candidatus Levybacteria bacterium RIFCSPLOWO2_12_FULL_37_7]
MRNKILLGLIILSILSFLVLVILSIKTPQDNAPKAFPAPTLYIQPLPNKQVSGIIYNSSSIVKLADKIDHRRPLNESEGNIRAKLISQALKNKQVVNINVSYAIYYSKSYDMFQVEILSEHIAKVKQDVTEWFKDQGFSQSGICNLPIMFVLRSSLKNQLQDKNITFSYLLEGC